MDYDALVPNPDPDPNPTPNLLKVDYDALVANGTYCELSKIGASLYNEVSRGGRGRGRGRGRGM